MSSPVTRSAVPLEFARFVAAGLVNTSVTLLLFELLRRAIPYLAAYSLTYLIGIGLSYLLNASFVFKVRKSVRTAASFPLVYVVQYLVGALLMWTFVGRFAWHPTVAMIIVVVATLPLTFLMTRWVLRRTNP